MAEERRKQTLAPVAGEMAMRAEHGRSANFESHLYRVKVGLSVNRRFN
jgi:hypothetical protein